METTHDLLRQVLKNQEVAKIDRGWIKKILGNHLKHHWVITVGAWTAALAAITGLMLLLLRGIYNG